MAYSDCSVAGRSVDAKLVALLEAVSGEVSVVAQDIIQLGDALAGDTGTAGSEDLQAFDLISQNAVAQARLLREISRKIAVGETHADSLLPLIEAVPFHKSRLRLMAALAGKDLRAECTELPEPVDGTDWF